MSCLSWQSSSSTLGVDNLHRQFSRTLDTGPYSSGSNARLPPFSLLIRLVLCLF